MCISGRKAHNAHIAFDTYETSIVATNKLTEKNELICKKKLPIVKNTVIFILCIASL